MSFITEEVKDLSKYMKFIRTPSQTRIFWPLPHYQSLKSRGEQDPTFWKEVATAFVEIKYNTDTSRNGYHIKMFQRGLSHKPYFVTINNLQQIIISPSKKIVATHIVGELEVIGWFMRTWMLKWGYCYNQCLLENAWIRVKGIIISLATPHVVSVSATCSRCCYLALSLWFPHVLILMYISLLNYGLT